MNTITIQNTDNSKEKNLLQRKESNILDENKIQIVDQIIQGRNGDIKIRLYKINKDEFMPAVLVFHGGNFIDGSFESCDKFCRFLCEKSNSVIVNVDYRLAPKYEFPQGIFDCYDSIRYIYKNSDKLGINKDCICICGENAGGNIATACAMIDKDLKTNYINFQVLISPTVYLDECDYKDYKFDMNLYGKKSSDPKWINYMQDTIRLRKKAKYYYMGTDDFINNQYASPLCAPSLKGLSDVLMMTCEDDYLRLQDEAYYRKLKKNDVNVKNITYKRDDKAVIENIYVSNLDFDVCNNIAKEINNRFS